MTSNIAISFEHVSKTYQLGSIGTGTLSQDIEIWFKRLFSKSANPARHDSNKKSIRAIDNLSFEIAKGEIVGLIGANGAGKSTILKLLSHITYPSSGSIQYKGKIASLLEVGTGFHPELTGRENVALNATLLGMSKNDLRKRFDDIVAFADCHLFIDTPVKRYSSGMKLRLGFAVAAFLEPDILLVDEVLAVGDVNFQQRALGKMDEVSKSSGRTVVFVSHNMSSVRSLCTSCIILEKGKNIFQGNVNDGISQYLNINQKDSIAQTSYSADPESTKFPAHISKAFLNDPAGVISAGKTLSFNCSIQSATNGVMELYAGIYDVFGAKIAHFGQPFQDDLDHLIIEKELQLNCVLPSVNLVEGTYFINLSLHFNGQRTHWVKKALYFTIVSDRYFSNGRIIPPGNGVVLLDQKWTRI